MITYTPRFDRSRLREAIRKEYSEVAANPTCGFHFLAGRPLAVRLGYGDTLLNGMPEGALASFAGVGNPFAIAPLQPGATVLDVGSGAGFDALIAARMVGPHGEVIGVDMTDSMVEKATQYALEAGITNVRFVKGYAEALPLPDRSVDVVLSNGVINLCPDKKEVFSEIHRVLKPGGRIQIADTLVAVPVSPYVKDLIHLWTDCVAGGVTPEEYVRLLQEAGFRDVQVVASFDTFQGAVVEDTADRYGARGHNVLGYA